MAITIVTGNSHKCEQITYALEQYGIVASCASVEIDEIQTLDNERLISQKVRDAFEQLQRPVLVDDGGFFIHRYSNFPGVFSKFIYKALDFDGLMRLVEEGEPCSFRAFIAYYDAQLHAEHADPVIFSGEYAGVVTKQFEREQNSEMPYALFFVPNGFSAPLAQLTPEQREGDHRHQAVSAFAKWYSENR